jgi:membrane fusion protein (multidrug efflux system)
MWIIEHGLAVGERVVVDGFSKVKDGQTVAPTPAVLTPTANAAAESSASVGGAAPSAAAGATTSVPNAAPAATRTK